MDLTEALMGFGLTRQESTIYLALLSDGALTGYEAAKRTGISRSNTYTALACLVDKGAARLMEGTPVRYIPVDVEEFSDYKLKHLEEMKRFLQERLPVQSEAMEGYITIQGDSHISDKIWHMLEHAVYRVYVSGEHQVLDHYRNLLEQRAAEGIKVVILTNPPYELPGAKVYLADRKPGQVGIIVDSATVLTGDVGNGEQSACLYSGKKNLVDLFKDSLSNEIKIIELTGRNEIK
jgi:sugar-specific transcriptional regulator TrmB